MLTINRIIGLTLLMVLVYGLLKVCGVLPDWMPALPTSGGPPAAQADTKKEKEASKSLFFVSASQL